MINIAQSRRHLRSISGDKLFAQLVVEIELFNLLGQKILTKTTSLNAEVLDLSPYPLGTYLVKFTSKDFNTTKKLTKN